jgi:hypothetical protein
MLNRNNRQLFSDAIKLPENSVVGRIYGTTFTCSLEMIIGILLWVDGNDKNYKEQIRWNFLKAFLKQRIKSLYGISVVTHHIKGENANRLIELLDTVLYEVYNVGSNISSQVPLIKYSTSDNNKEIRYRFIIMSRNFTMSDSWDVIFAAEGALVSTVTPIGEQILLSLLI